MNIQDDQHWGALSHLMTTLASEFIDQGGCFRYEGVDLLPEDFTDLMHASILIFAQHTARRLLLGELGYDFVLVSTTPDASPLVARRTVGYIPQPALEYPLVLEIFEVEVMAFQDDLSLFMQQAALLEGLPVQRNIDHEQTVFEALSSQETLTREQVRAFEAATRPAAGQDALTAQDQPPSSAPLAPATPASAVAPADAWRFGEHSSQPSAQPPTHRLDESYEDEKAPT